MTTTWSSLFSNKEKKMSNFLVAYDIVESKRRVKVAKLVYGYALGGQKSALEVPVDAAEVEVLTHDLSEKIDWETDKVNIIKVDKDVVLLGVATHLKYDDGVVLL
jgi:CRISPR-associated protein Cas2